MKSILHDLYYGNIQPSEQFKPISSEQRKRLLEQNDKYHSFEKKLNETDQSLFPLFFELYNDLFLTVPYEDESAFICGFRMGVRIMIESMQTNYWK